jgi:DNA-binding response OmpR family regulator
LCSALAHELAGEGHRVDSASSSQAALQMLESLAYDAVVLDPSVSGADGRELMERTCGVWPGLPVVILTARANLESAIAAVRAGAVDYVIKPDDSREAALLAARTLREHATDIQRHRLLRAVGELVGSMGARTAEPLHTDQGSESEREVIYVTPIRLDRVRHEVAVEGARERTCVLTPSETALLAVLLTYPNRVLSCIFLAGFVLGRSAGRREAENVIRHHVSRVRQKIEKNPARPRLIRSVRGKGYVFVSAGQP